MKATLIAVGALTAGGIALLGLARILTVEPSYVDVSVIDGDTLKTSSGERVRIYNIDAPEISHPRCAAEFIAGQAAKRALEHMVEAGPVEIDRCEPATGRCTDKYGRTLAAIKGPSGDIGQALVDEGLALPWKAGPAAHLARARHWCPDTTQAAPEDD